MPSRRERPAGPASRDRLAAVVATKFRRIVRPLLVRDDVKRAEQDVGVRYLVEDGSWAADSIDPERPRFLERVRFAQV